MPNTNIPTPEGFFDQYFSREREVPDGFMTVGQMAERYGAPRSTISSRMQALLDAGEVRRIYVKSPDSRGRMVETAYYGPVQRSEPAH